MLDAYIDAYIILIFRGCVGFTFAVCPLESNGDHKSVYIIFISLFLFLLFDFVTQSDFSLQKL